VISCGGLVLEPEATQEVFGNDYETQQTKKKLYLFFFLGADIHQYGHRLENTENNFPQASPSQRQ